MKSKLKSSEPYIANGKHVTRGEFFIYLVEFEDGTKGFKRSLKTENPYIVGSEYEFQVDKTDKGDIINAMKRVEGNSDLDRKIAYSGMMEKAVAFTINTKSNPTVKDCHEINLEMLKYQDSYVTGESL